eukprot:763793-Hanusia_phi.AAC.5
MKRGEEGSGGGEVEVCRKTSEEKTSKQEWGEGRVGSRKQHQRAGGRECNLGWRSEEGRG